MMMKLVPLLLCHPRINYVSNSTDIIFIGRPLGALCMFKYTQFTTYKTKWKRITQRIIFLLTEYVLKVLYCTKG